MENMQQNIDSTNTTTSALPGADIAPSVTPEDVDAIFGDQGAGDAGTGDGTTSQGSDQQGQEDLTGKSAEEIARMFQSKYDKTASALSAIEQENTRLKEFESFFNSIYEDDKVKQAFLYELAPEKFKPQEPHAFVEEGLAKEFGKDFEPDPSQEKTPGTKTWLYYKRADDLYKQAVDAQQGGVTKGLKELKAEREQARQNQLQAAAQQKQELVNKFKWDKPTTDNFINWANSLSLTHLGQFYQFALKQKAGQTGSPSLAAQSGGAPTMPNEFQQHLKQMFG